MGQLITLSESRRLIASYGARALRVLFNMCNRLAVAGIRKFHLQKNFRSYRAALAFAIVFAVPACAQKSDTPASAPPTRGAPQVDVSAVPDLPDPPADESPQSMFPHFKDTRLWLSGEANFVVQTHPEFHAPYSGP